jgi:hypothetical protein
MAIIPFPARPGVQNDALFPALIATSFAVAPRLCAHALENLARLPQASCDSADRALQDIGRSTEPIEEKMPFGAKMTVVTIGTGL